MLINILAVRIKCQTLFKHKDRIEVHSFWQVVGENVKHQPPPRAGSRHHRLPSSGARFHSRTVKFCPRKENPYSRQFAGLQASLRWREPDKELKSSLSKLI